MEQPPQKPLLNLNEVAVWLGVSNGTIRNWMRDQGFPDPIRLGKLAKWRRGDVLAWMDGRPQGFGSKPDG